MKKLILIIALIISGCSQKATIKDAEISEEFEQRNNKIVTIKNLEAKKHFIRGLTYSLQELPEKAVLEFQEALIFEDNPNINFALAVQLFRINKLDLALKYLEKVLSLPDDSIHPDFLLVAAQIYLSKRDYDKTLSSLERLLRIDSTNIEALYNLAQLKELKDKSKAKQLYERILSIQPENRVVIEALLNYYYEEKNFEKVEELLKNLIFNEPFEIELRLRLVGLYREWGKNEKAKDVIIETTERFPDDITSKLYLIEMSIEEKDYENVLKSLNQITKSIDLNEEEKISLFDFVTAQSIKDTVLKDLLKDFFEKLVLEKDTLALTYLFLINVIENKKDDADRILRDLIFDEKNLELLKRFGGQFYIDGKYEQATYLLTKILDYSKDDFNIIVTLGQAYLMLEDYNNAANYLVKASELNSENPELLNITGYVLGKLKRYDEAIFFTEKALSLDNKNRNVLINLGLLLDDVGYFDKSDSLYEEALKIYPDDPTLLNNYAYSLAKRKVNLEKALAMSKKSLEKDSLVSSYLDTLGWIYFQMGKVIEAEYYIKLAIDQGSPSAEILEHMGDVYLKMNKKDEALEYYKMALKLDPENQNLKNKIEEIE